MSRVDGKSEILPHIFILIVLVFDCFGESFSHLLSTFFSYQPTYYCTFWPFDFFLLCYDLKTFHMFFRRIYTFTFSGHVNRRTTALKQVDD